MNELALVEQDRLAELENTIEAGLQTFVAVGTALLEIRDSRLYRQEFGTFEEYCGERWGFTKIRANMLMDGAEIARNLETTGFDSFSERAVRPLKKLQPEQQREVYRRAVETAPNGKVTAAHVAQTVKEYEQEFETVPEDEPEDVIEDYVDYEEVPEFQSKTDTKKTAEAFQYPVSDIDDCERVLNRWWDAERPETMQKLRRELWDMMVAIDQRRGDSHVE